MGYNLIQAESSISFILTLTAKHLKMEEQEFKDRCLLSSEREKAKMSIIKNNTENINNNESENDSSDEID